MTYTNVAFGRSPAFRPDRSENAFVTSVYARLPRAIRRPLLTGLLITFCVTGQASAATSLAEDHTILYYLVEMQRRHTRTCGGQSMPDAPPLIPSNILRQLADQAVDSQQDPTAFAAQHGLSIIPFVAVTARGSTPRQIFDDLAATNCPSIMGPDYRYIGAAGRGGTWTVILAANDPDSIMPEPEVRLEPDNTSKNTPPQSNGMDVPVRSQMPEAPRSGPDLVPLTPPQPVHSGSANARERAPEDTRAASPIIIGEMDLDYAGRPVGRLRPVENGSSEAALPSPVLVDTPKKTETNIGKVPKRSQPVSSAIDSPQTMASSSRSGVTPLHDERPTTEQAPIILFPKAPEAGTDSATQPLRATNDRQTIAVNPLRQAPDLDRLLALANKTRLSGAVCGTRSMLAVKTLRRNPQLNSAAGTHAADMAARRYFSSLSPEGVTLGQRISATGHSWGIIAENIASLAGSEENVLNQWMNNQAQCENIMSPEFTDVGLGVDPGGRVWVMTFSMPMNVVSSVATSDTIAINASNSRFTLSLDAPSALRLGKEPFRRRK